MKDTTQNCFQKGIEQLCFLRKIAKKPEVVDMSYSPLGTEQLNSQDSIKI